MREILGKEYKLNQIVCVSFLNSRRNLEILSGRIMDYDNNHIWLDVSDDFVSMDEIVKVKIDNIKYINVTINHMWR